jgi:flagellar basal body-associated protein FliL
MELFNRKKAQGMSLNIIIIAAIGLLVLVILAVIFIGRIGTTTKSIDSCKGSCIDSADDCVGQYQKVTSDPCFASDGKTRTEQICCVSAA